MNELTLETLFENPRHVLTYAWPVDPPPRRTLIVAQIAATCLRQMAGEMLDAYTDRDDAYAKSAADQALALFFESDRKVTEIIGALAMLYDVPPYDYWLPLFHKRKAPAGLLRRILRRCF